MTTARRAGDRYTGPPIQIHWAGGGYPHAGDALEVLSRLRLRLKTCEDWQRPNARVAYARHRAMAMKPATLPKPATHVHPIFADLFRSLGLAA